MSRTGDLEFKSRYNHLLIVVTAVSFDLIRPFFYHTGENDIIMGGFRTKFQDDLEELKTSNTDSIEKLLMGFFNYYRQFDFQNKSVNLARVSTR